MSRIRPTFLTRTILGLAIAGGVSAIALPLLEARLGSRSFASDPAPAVPAGGGSAPALAKVTALGRLEPRDGVIRIAGPSRSGAVIAKLFVEKGDPVKTGQVIAELDTLAESRALVARAQAQLASAQADFGRIDRLYREKTTSIQARDDAQLKLDVARAELQSAQAALEMAVIRAPTNGRVLDVHARSGERVGPAGLIELGQTEQMYAVAEVYETDIGRVRVGQRASAKSPALSEPLTGKVESIGLKIGKLDTLSTDPAASADARVVEVKILLDDSPRAAGLTNLTVEVAIEGNPT